jgi:hypothetical protein
MTEVTTHHTTLPANFGESLMKGIAETRSAMNVSGGGKPLLRLLKSGKWVIGQQNEPVEATAEWAVNIASLARGWVCWYDGELLGQTMASVQAERLPQPTPISVPQPAPVDRVPFAEQFSMELTCILGEAEGTEVLYKNHSAGFTDAFNKLLGEIQARWSADPVYFWPVITLQQTSYQHKKHGEIWKPLLEVVAWTDQDGEFSPDSTAAEPAGAVAPVEPAKVARAPRAAQRAPEPVPEPLPSAHTHVGQRRRPAAR